VALRSIGKVTASEKNPTTCNAVRFWVHEDVVLRPFDVVRIEHISREPGGKASHTYALIQDLQYITDSAGDLANYVSSDFGSLSAEPQNRRLGTTIAEAEVLYNDQEIEMPVRDGSKVEWADAEGVKDALGLRAFQQPIPAGYISMSNGEEIPIEFEASYLLGPEGAHLNIAGISGLATKTSYAMFLMNSIQQKLPNNVTMIIFNVKKNDLLSIDVPCELTEEVKKEWQKCGLKPIPFRNVTYLYPFSNCEETNYTISHVPLDILANQIKNRQAFNYFYDFRTGLSRLPMLFSDIDDPNSTMESIIHQLPEFDVESWDAFRQRIGDYTKKGSTKSNDISVMSWRKFKRLLDTRTDHDIFTERAYTKAGEKRHILIREAISKLKPGSVLVIDIEPLPAYLQCFVVGDVIETVYGAKHSEDEKIDPSSLGTVVVFADELNKYAPKSSRSTEPTLTRNLLEITERGRSLGMVLFGAEQFRSGVHDRVLGNCSTNVFGRTSAVETAKSPDYKYFPQTYKSAISRLPQGHLLLQHAVFKTHLIKVRFPHPCYYQPKAKVR